jgi:hypothetical protein
MPLGLEVVVYAACTLTTTSVLSAAGCVNVVTQLLLASTTSACVKAFEVVDSGGSVTTTSWDAEGHG